MTRAFASRCSIDRTLENLAARLSGRAPVRAEPGSYEIEAAVAVCLRPGRESHEILFILRAVDEDDPWSGHVAFPGGRREEADSSLWDTAVRETLEETGVDLGRIGRRLGQLDDVHPRTSVLPSIVISPFAFSVPEGAVAIAGPEVQEVAWIPLAALARPESRSQIEIRAASGVKAYPSLRHGGYEIWGLTHRILTQLLEFVEQGR